MASEQAAVSTGLTFIELCAGTAALSVRLQGGPYARPPVSRMGAKTGYSKAILSIMGLRAGQGAERFVWAEPDDGCRLLLHAYAEPELARAAARQLEQWVDEDPRALWDRLKAIGPINNFNGRELARYTVALPGGAWTAMPPLAMYKGPGCHSSMLNTGLQGTLAKRYRSLAEHPALICSSASDVPLPDVLSTLSGRCVVYIDPPYQNTTGYAHDLTRVEVKALARLWSDAGAAVYISEAEPIDLPGWHKVNITGCRVGKKRTFSKQQAEYITCNRVPAWVPDEQGTLF